MSSALPSNLALPKPVLIIGIVTLAIITNVPTAAAVSIEGNVVSCYDTEYYCKANCSQKCYYVDNCNGSARSMYACAPNIFLIVAIIVGVVLVLLLLCCISCCCCPCCLFAQCIKRKKQIRQSRIIMPAVLPPAPLAPPAPPGDGNYTNGYTMDQNVQEPPADGTYSNGYPMEQYAQQPPPYIEEDLTKV